MLRVVKPDTLLIFLLFTPMITMIFLLANTTVETSNRLTNTQIFFALLLGSIIALVLALGQPRIRNLIKWYEGLDTRDLLYIVVGYLGVLGIAIALSSINPLVAILGAGFVLFFVLLQTKTILSVIAIHGFYNSTVLLMQSGIITNLFPLSGSPIKIPLVSFGLEQLDRIAAEAIFQLILVAPAEEFVKVAAATGIAIGFVSVLGLSERAGRIAGAIFAVSLWAISHAIVAIKII